MIRRSRALLGAAAVMLLGTACEDEMPYEQIAGPVYDFRMVVEATAGPSMPGGNIRVFGAAADSLIVNLTGLAPLSSGGYSVFLIDAAGAPVGETTGVVTDSLGRARVKVTGTSITAGSSVVVGFGGAFASAYKPLWASYRSATGTILTTQVNLSLGAYGTTPRLFKVPAASKWGRGGLWIDQPNAGDTWLRGYMLHVPLAPNGFEYNVWVAQLGTTGGVVRAASIGGLADTLGVAVTDPENPPAGAALADLGKLFYDTPVSAIGGVLADSMTHVLVTVEPRGAKADYPSAAILYRGAFPRQYLIRPKD